jgi:UDP-N-acetyl-D-galactosamine dehydrogenase
MISVDEAKIVVLGLGYVGFPLAVEFGKKFDTLGFDIDPQRIEELARGYDRTLELSQDQIRAATHLTLSFHPQDLRSRNVYIIAVPTPIDGAKRPELSSLLEASRTVAKAINPGAIVIFESTVYPGMTEEICAPLIEKLSGLKLNSDFTCGYSPERANPGDREHRLTNTVKVTSGSTPEAAEFVDRLYASIVTAGTHRAPSIKVAEAAKVIENTQRDLNIALVNELAKIFEKLEIDTNDVLAAASTKWNFNIFKPGLVGGHCIGVDPYYLTHRAQEVGYRPEVILAGRRINDEMGAYLAGRVADLMMKRGLPVVGSRVLVMGLAFKENCPDVRNSKVVDVIGWFKEHNASVDVLDPWVKAQATSQKSTVVLLQEEPQAGVYDAIVLAVGHRQYVEMGATKIRGFGKKNAVFFDVKGVFEKSQSDGRL